MIGVKSCKKCLMPGKYPNISFNSQGICSFCTGKQKFGVTNNELMIKKMSQKDELKKDFEITIKQNRGKSDYDCLVPISGGKDSAYLSYILKEKYKLNILGFTVNNGFISSIAKKNIDNIVEKLSIDHIFYTPKMDFFKRFYKYFLTHPNFSKKKYEEIGYLSTVCYNCCQVIHSISLKYAADNNIELVTLGYSPDQIEHYFYNIPMDEIKNTLWIPKELYHKPFTENDKKNFWDPKKIREDGIFPKVLMPFHVIEYPGSEEIQKKLSNIGLIKKGKGNPVFSNCLLNWLMIYLDFKKLGYIPVLPGISYQIRQGYYNINDWKFFITGLNFIIKYGIYHKLIGKKNIDFILNKLDLEMKDFN